MAKILHQLCGWMIHLGTQFGAPTPNLAICLGDRPGRAGRRMGRNEGREDLTEITNNLPTEVLLSPPLHSHHSHTVRSAFGAYPASSIAPLSLAITLLVSSRSLALFVWYLYRSAAHELLIRIWLSILIYVRFREEQLFLQQYKIPHASLLQNLMRSSQ